MGFIKKFSSAILLLILLIAISISALLFFKAFEQPPFNAFFGEGGFSTEILAAFLGAIITMVITAILLKSQTAMEESKENRKELFSKKLGIYHEFLAFIADIIENDDIDKEELILLKKWALKLSLICNTESQLTLILFIKQVSTFKKFKYIDLTDKEKIEFFNSFNDMGIFDKIKETEVEQYFVTIPKIVSTLKFDLGQQLGTSIELVAEMENSLDFLFRP